MLDTSLNFKPKFRDSPLYFTKLNTQTFIRRKLQYFYLFYVVACTSTKKEKKYVHMFFFPTFITFISFSLLLVVFYLFVAVKINNLANIHFLFFPVEDIGA